MGLGRMCRAAVLGVALGGCGLTQPPDLSVETQWRDTLRRLETFGIYPPTEDVHVGEVVLVVPAPSGIVAGVGRVADAIYPFSRPDHDATRFSLRRLGYLGGAVTAALKDQQGEHPQIAWLPREAATPDGRTPRTPAARNPAVPTPTRLAIPGLSVARTTLAQADAGGLFGGLLGGLLRGLGLGISSESSIDIVLGDLQQMSLDERRLNQAMRAAEDLFWQNISPELLLDALRDMRHGWINTHDLTRPACRGDRVWLQNQGAQVVVLSRVIYAGRIEYVFSERFDLVFRGLLAAPEAAAALAAAPDQPASEAATRAARSAEQAGTAATAAEAALRRAEAAAVATEAARATAAGASPDAARQQALATRIEALERRLRDMRQSQESLAGRLNVTEPGGRARFGTSTLGRLALIDEYEQPLAVAAGARRIIAFHDALRGGRHGEEAKARERFDAALRWCRREFTTRGLYYPQEQKNALRAAMDVP